MKTKYSALLALAKAQTQRQENGQFNEEDLRATLEQLVTIDPEAEKRRVAKAIIDSETKPGSTEPTGQLSLGFDSYDYEPDRLIRDDDGHVIEQDKALHSYKFAESKRAAKHWREAGEWADRKRQESEAYATWIIEQQQRGRQNNLTFGDFIREAGIFEALAQSRS